MDIEDVGIKKTNSRKQKNNEEEQYRLIINKETNDLLESLVGRTNDGFVGGEVSKSDVASLLIQNAAKDFDESDIRSLRSRYFDEKKILRAILRKSGDDGELPEILKKVIREQFGLSEGSKKKTAKNSNDLSTSKIVDNNSAA